MCFYSEKEFDTKAFCRMSCQKIVDIIKPMIQEKNKLAVQRQQEWFNKNRVFYKWSWLKFRKVIWFEASNYQDAENFYIKNVLPKKGAYHSIYTFVETTKFLNRMHPTISVDLVKLNDAATKMLTINGSEARMFVHQKLINQMDV